MFLIFIKQKIYSYLVALSTVIALFIIAATFSNRSGELIQTMSQLKIVPIYNVQTEDYQVSNKMYCFSFVM